MHITSGLSACLPILSIHVLVLSAISYNKKLSYRRETARQLRTIRISF